ncbi:MAG: TonB-dependent receptor [Gemmatimonadetes bacterium]|nr:TonB-dependent receptor [Gemmatimonadota bacterium]
MTRALYLGLLAAVLARAGVAAQGAPACDPGPPPVPASWPAPLDRQVTLHEGLVSLPDALARITTAARLRLSYSRDLLPPARRTCLEFSGTPVGAVLERILSGTSLAPVVAGIDRVVLATDHAALAVAAEPVDPDVVVLDGIAVNAQAAAPDRPAGVVVASVDGRALEQQGASTLADALDGLVPGVWVWARGSSSPLTQYASVRGASSFGPSSPKLYIDGLEVANPLLVSTLDPATIERIDVLRGPQSGALFGADAGTGVTSIITRQGAIDASGSRALLRSGVGLAGSAFAPSGALAQEHGLSAFAGPPARSARLDLAFSSLGDYIPDAASNRLSAVGSARAVSARFALTATARLLSERSSLSESPLLPAMSGLDVAATSRALAVGQYTAGLTAAYRPGEHWTHTLVAGINGYTLSGAPTLAEAHTAIDSALAASGTRAFRTTLRLTSAARWPLGPQAEGGVTLVAEHSALRQNGGVNVAPWWEPLQQTPRRSPLLRPAVLPNEEPAQDRAESVELARARASSSLSSRFDATVHERLNLSAGMRLEHTTLENGGRGSALLPNIGASWTAVATGPLQMVLRAAWGQGGRWPQAPGAGMFARQLQVLPELQSGTEAGIDLAVGRALTLQATRFDQTATGLTQQVAVTRDSTAWRAASTILLAQNVGTIGNRGWELSALARHGPLTLSGTLSLVDSRVRALATGYHGDLTAGDRMLGVPARTASIGALWARPRWSAGLSLGRASDWLNYDRIALARARADSVPLTTAQLRDYWLHFAGTTRLRATFNRDLGNRLSLRLTGDNLLDIQPGDPDTTTLVPGRTLSLRVRARL